MVAGVFQLIDVSPPQIASVVEEAWGDSTTSIGIHIDFRALQKLQVSSLAPPV
jgi:hypothetical protein